MPETQPKPFVFVLMPFDVAFKDLYEFGIKAACSDAGAYCERVDEQIYEENMMQRVYNQIAKADLLVAEMTGKNPNVFYEVGYAHALGKRVILITKDASDIPFDLKHYPHVIHGGRIGDLKPELTKRVKWAVENPAATSQFFNPTLECFINSIKIIEKPQIPKKADTVITLEIAIHNSVARTIDTISFQVGFIVPKTIHLVRFSHDSRREDPIGAQQFGIASDQVLWLLEPSFGLMPGGWTKLFALVQFSPSSAGEFECAIRIFTHTGLVEFPFSLK